MIRSFRDKDTERLWNGDRVRRFEGFRRQALRRLDVLNAASRLEDLMMNPGNMFEALRGQRAGQYSIRINRQWRLCFEWDGEHAANVEIVDYH